MRLLFFFSFCFFLGKVKNWDEFSVISWKIISYEEIFFVEFIFYSVYTNVALYGGGFHVYVAEKSLC